MPSYALVAQLPAQEPAQVPVHFPLHPKKHEPLQGHHAYVAESFFAPLLNLL